MQGVLFLALLWASFVNSAFGMGIEQIQYMSQEQFVQQAFTTGKPQCVDLHPKLTHLAP